MEYERYFFKFHKGALKSPLCRPLLLGLILLSSVLVIFSGGAFIWTHKAYVVQNRAIVDAIYQQVTRNVTKVTYGNSVNFTSPITNITTNTTLITIENVTLNGPAAIFSDDILHVIITRDQASAEALREEYAKKVSLNNGSFYTAVDLSSPGIYKAYEYGQSFSVLFLDEYIKSKFNITSHAVFVPLDSIASNLFGKFLFYAFADFGTAVANQLAAAFKGKDGSIMEALVKEKAWLWKQAHYTDLTFPSLKDDPAEFLFYKFLMLSKTTFVFAIMSVLSSIALHISTISVVVLYILAVQILHWICRLHYAPSALYEQFPWIGALAAYLARKGKSDKYVLWAYFGFFCFSYLFWCVGHYLWKQVFERTKPYCSDNGAGYFYYIQVMELILLLFCRTRVSIKYLPKLLTAYNLLFLFYLYSYFYPFSGLALFLLIMATVLTISVFLLMFEQPALSWEDRDKFKPVSNNPRQGYIPVPLMNFSFGFDLWTVFYPPAFRSAFRQSEQTHIATDVEMMLYDFSVERMANPNLNQEGLLVQVEGNRQPAYEMQEQPIENLNEV